MKNLIYLILLTPASVNASPANNWKVVLSDDLLSNKRACLIQSVKLNINDGQSNTPVRFIYNGQSFIVSTRSNIDLSYPGVGLIIDKKPAIKIDHTFKQTNIVFETEADLIRKWFIEGRTARLTLGFWPTWPKTKTITTKFSLLGFTRAYDAFQQCQRTGEIR